MPVAQQCNQNASALMYALPMYFSHALIGLNRMVFSHHITALEAYLADTLIKAVLADKDAMYRLMKGDKELAKERFSLEEIAGAPNLVKTRVREYLLSIRYHNLNKVNFLYKTALQVPILDFAQDKDRLFKAIALRHDCVHRNGHDKDGNILTEFTKEYVQNIANVIRDFVEKINKQLPLPAEYFAQYG